MNGFNHNNSILRICVDRIADRTLSGCVLSRRLTQPLPFNGLTELALQMEAVFEQQNFPQASQRIRTFLRSESFENFAAPSPAHGMGEEMVMEGRGEIATFDVTVISRRNSTWQGVVNWLDGSELREFTSYLDLMRLINEKQF